MKNKNYQSFKKGMGIIVSIPGDEHNGIQNKRPGIVINSNPDYVTVQLLSSQTSKYDYISFVLNNKTQYVRTIYLKNVMLSQITDIWKEFKKDKVVQLSTEGKIMKAIENNPYKASSITLSIDEYLNFKNKILTLEKKEQEISENRLLQKLVQKEKKEYEKK